MAVLGCLIVHVAADRHRVVRHRQRAVPDRADRPPGSRAVVRAGGGITDRARRGRGLRALHRHTLPRATAGRAVLFAGTTVIIAVLGLLLLRQPLMNGVAVAAAVTVACVLAGSLTLLPALLGFAGTRLAKRSRLTRRTRGGEAEPSRSVSTRVGAKPAGSARRVPLAERWVGGMQRRPVFAAAASAAVILALAAPVLAIHLNLPDESTQPPDTMGYQSYQTMAEGFAPGSTRRCSS